MNNINIIFSILNALRHWLESIEIRHLWVAHLICQVIPASCPFERKLVVGEHMLVSIPPLCKLNPFYEQLTALRFQSLVYLTEKGNEDAKFSC